MLYSDVPPAVPTPTGTHPRLLTLPEVARLTSTSLRFIQRCCAEGRLRVIELSPRCRRIEASQLDAFIRQSALGRGN